MKEATSTILLRTSMLRAAHSDSYLSPHATIFCVTSLLLNQQQAWERRVRAPTCRITEPEIKKDKWMASAFTGLQKCSFSFVTTRIYPCTSRTRIPLRAWNIRPFWSSSPNKMSFLTSPYLCPSVGICKQNCGICFQLLCYFEVLRKLLAYVIFI
jgi:hypothetical protein